MISSDRDISKDKAVTPPKIELVGGEERVEEEIKNIKLCPILSQSHTLSAPPIIEGGEPRIMLRVVPAACIRDRCEWWNSHKGRCGVAVTPNFNAKKGKR